jgi:hypothetical protein
MRLGHEDTHGGDVRECVLLTGGGVNEVYLVIVGRGKPAAGGAKDLVVAHHGGARSGGAAVGDGEQHGSRRVLKIFAGDEKPWHCVRYLDWWHFKVPALLKKLPLFIFGGSFKSAALSGVGKCIYRQFFKVPAIVIPVADLKCRLLHLRQFAKKPANLFKGSLPKSQENLFQAVLKNARKIILRQF